MSEIRGPEPVERHEEVRITGTADNGHGQRIVEDVAAERQGEIARITQIVWLLFGILNGLIAIRFLLRLVGANPNNGFAEFISRITRPFMLPFITLTATPSAGPMVVDIPALIAIVVYSLLAWVIVKLIWLLLYRPSARTVTTYRRD